MIQYVVTSIHIEAMDQSFQNRLPSCFGDEQLFTGVSLLLLLSRVFLWA